MKLPSVHSVWIVIALIATLLGVGLLARAKSRDGVIYSLKSYAVEKNQPERKAIEQFAGEVFNGELGKYIVDEKVVTAAYNVLKQTEVAEASRQRLELYAKNLLEREIALAHSDDDLLELGDRLLALAASPDRGIYRGRIAMMSKEREAEAAALGQLAHAVSRNAGAPEGDAAFAQLVESRLRFTAGPHAWVLRQNPAIASAVESADAAALQRFKVLLQQAQTSGPEMTPRLRDAWAGLRAMKLQDRVEAAERTYYAAQARVNALPPAAFNIAVCVLMILVGGMAYAIRSVIKGPIPIDPGAETLENVEPIDFDTDAETLEAAKHRSTRVGGESHDTTMH